MTTDIPSVKPPRWWPQIQLGAAIATILGLGVTIFFALQATRTKLLEVSYLAKLSLINASEDPAGQITVSYGGQPVRRPFKTVARLWNTGTLPIEKGDIEQPVTFSFDAATVLAVNIVKRSPDNLQVTVTSTPKSVVVSHGLLNSGDFLDLEILSDGDPGWPVPIFRISGVNSSPPRVPDGAAPLRPTFFTFSRAVEWLVVVTAALVGPILLFVAVALSTNLYRASRWKRDATKVLDSFKPTEEPAKVKEELANAIYQRLQSPVDRKVFDAVMAMDHNSATEPTPQLVERTRGVVLKTVGDMRFRDRYEWAQVIAAAICYLVGWAVMLVTLAAVWSTATT